MAAHHRTARKPVASAPENAREVAATVLMRVADQGAFAMRALDAEIRRAKLCERDAALATEITYGSLRVLPELDEAIAPFLKRPLSEMDSLTRAVLRAATYQLRHLARVPAHAIVDCAVHHLRKTRGRSVGGFANAVLRRLSERRPDAPEPPTRTVIPAWLQDVLHRSLGPERTGSLLQGRTGPPPLCLAVPGGARDALIADLRARLPRADVQPGALGRAAVLLRRAGDPRRLPGYAEGRFWVQEEGAQLVGQALGAMPTDRVADVCAGHGGKSLFIALGMAGRGQLASIDVDESKLDQIGPELERTGLDDIEFAAHAIDVRVGLGGLSANFDRVLVDAPCTGLGTLHRRPELLLRLVPEDLTRLSDLQSELVVSAASLVRPGGRLTYAVCSLSSEEGARVADVAERRLGRLERLDASEYLFDINQDSDGIVRLGPWLSRGASVPDGYQLISWRVGA